MNRYSDEQKKIHDYIKSLHDEGYGYLIISKIFNLRGIKTQKGNLCCNSKIHFVLKKFRQKKESLTKRNKRHQTFRSKMYIRFEKK